MPPMMHKKSITVFLVFLILSTLPSRVHAIPVRDVLPTFCAAALERHGLLKLKPGEIPLDISRNESLNPLLEIIKDFRRWSYSGEYWTAYWNVPGQSQDRYIG